MPPASQQLGDGFVNAEALRPQLPPHVDEPLHVAMNSLDFGTALTLCRDQKLPVNVFSIFKKNALQRIVAGENEGTLVHV